MNPFNEGQVYRRREIHQRFGGQQQGGMSTPSDHPLIFLFTGESGTQHGYADGWSDAGVFFYTGEGQVGDMQFIRANAALRDHAVSGKDVHLFVSHSRAHVRYLGQFVYTGHHTESGPDTKGNLRQRIVFELAPIGEFGLESPQEETESESKTPSAQEDLASLRARAMNAASSGKTPKERKVNVQRRSEAIRRYAIMRSGGSCESCKAPAPFKTKVGTPFLEVHHIHRLTDGGPDHPTAVAAICPNCHRRAHHSIDADEFNQSLVLLVQRKERAT